MGGGKKLNLAKKSLSAIQNIKYFVNFANSKRALPCDEINFYHKANMAG